MIKYDHIQDDLPPGIQLLDTATNLPQLLSGYQAYFAFYFHEGASRYLHADPSVLALYDSRHKPCPPQLLSEKGGQLFVLPKQSFPPQLEKKIQQLRLSTKEAFTLGTTPALDIRLLFEKIKLTCDTLYNYKELLLVNYASQLIHVMIKQITCRSVRSC